MQLPEILDGREGLPLIQKWEDTGKLKHDGDDASGHKLKTYWKHLEEEFKSKANKITSIIDLWAEISRQRSLGLNYWITKVYNMVQLCDYKDSKERIIRCSHH